MKAVLRAGSSGRVPAPSEKRFIIRSRAIAWGVVAAAAVAITVWVLHLYLSRKSASDAAYSRVAERRAWLATVPLPPEPVVPRQAAQPCPESPLPKPVLHEIAYDPAALVAENLVRLRNYIAADPHRPSLAMRTAGFTRALEFAVRTDLAPLYAAFDDAGSPAFFRALLLQVLVRIHAPGVEDLCWTCALDPTGGDLATAGARLLACVETSRPRPGDMLRVLETATGDRAIHALRASARHLDDEVRRRIEELVRTGDDVNVRVAAVHAAGASGAQSFLRTLAAVPPVPSSVPLAPDSLVKRTAVFCLDPRDPATAPLAQRIAEDPAEDPGIRRKAIVKLAQCGVPGAEDCVASLLRSTPDEDLIVVGGCAEALLMIGTPTARAAVESRAAACRDGELGRMLDHALHAGEGAS